MPLILLHKPYRVLSQFRDDDGRRTLAEFIAHKGIYPAGRLDYDSEGLLLLTDDGALQSRISDPKSATVKTYWAQIEGHASDEQLRQLCAGVLLKDGPAAARFARSIAEPANLWPRDPPIRFRKRISESWVELSISEGRNRQVRRMTAAVGLPTLRLIRCSVGPWSLNDLPPGQTRIVDTKDAWQQLRAASN